LPEASWKKRVLTAANQVKEVCLVRKYRYCTPEWLEGSGKIYREKPEFEDIR